MNQKRSNSELITCFLLLVFSVFKVRMSKFLLQLVICIHVFACSWYYVACPLNECSHDHNWVAEHQGGYSCGGRWDMPTTALQIHCLRSFLTFALRILTAHNLWRH